MHGINSEVTPPVACDPVPFTEDWDELQTLGEGAFGEVKLLVNKKTRDEVAVKIINLNIPSCRDATRKEIAYSYSLKSEKVQVEPEICGNNFHDACESKLGFMLQNLKPENLLLTSKDVLKISDFGMATIFRFKGEERLLTKRCGTLPYVAPEVLAQEMYRAEPADIWNCGVVLVAMLAGELPWDKPSANCERFNAWAECRQSAFRNEPFCKIGRSAMDLLKNILNCCPKNRATIEKIQCHPWITTDLRRKKDQNNKNSQKISSGKRFCSNSRISSQDFTNNILRRRPKNMFDVEEDTIRLCFSQPESAFASLDKDDCPNSPKNVLNDFIFRKPTSNSKKRSFDQNDCSNDSDTSTLVGDCDSSTTFFPNYERIGFSQPANFDNMLICTQSQCSQNSLNPMQKLVKRMTRFVTKERTEKIFDEIKFWSSASGFAVKYVSACQLTIQGTDSRGSNLSFKVTAYETFDQRVLIDFRLSKGDGIDFKRIFVRLRDRLKDFIDKTDDLDSWMIFGSQNKSSIDHHQNNNKNNVKLSETGISSLSVDSLKL
uniref:non-specific serine/threonine protein kinase n=1 Tax=Romanomermis culicivorax TaxID=13658 RepID=A0A915J9Z8_ROMCU